MELQRHFRQKNNCPLQEQNFNYTIGGLFVSFQHITDTAKFSVFKPNLILNGVKIVTT